MVSSEHKIDFQRIKRIGFGEAIFCESKNCDQIDAILNEASNKEAELLLTRLCDVKFESLSDLNKNKIQFDPKSQTGFFQLKKKKGVKDFVAVISAGTSDSKVSWEVIRTLEFNGIISTSIFDIGVSGLWRLQENITKIKNYPIVIVVAGMDAALPTVIGGLFPGVIIAVPTSVGYGIARNGETALMSCLVSCAPGVTVCNIDNGYGAAIAALRVISTLKTLKPWT